MALTTGETTYSRALETQVIYLHTLTTMLTIDNTGASWHEAEKDSMVTLQSGC